MTARIAQRLDHEIGGAVDHLGLVGEIGGGVHEAGQFHHTLEPVQIAITGGADLRQKAQRTAARGGGTGVDIHISAQTPGDQPIRPVGDLARDIDGIAGDHEGHVVRGGCGRVGQGDAEFGKAGGQGHDGLPLVAVLGGR